MDISRKRERKLQRQEAVMMTVKDRKNGLACPLLPGMTSPEPKSVGDMARDMTTDKTDEQAAGKANQTD